MMERDNYYKLLGKTNGEHGKTFLDACLNRIEKS
jgi:hypothetical protein